MSFLYPLLVTLGLPLVVVPLIIHFLNLFFKFCLGVLFFNMSRILSRLDVTSGTIEINIWLIDLKAINKLVKYDSIVVIQVDSTDNSD